MMGQPPPKFEDIIYESLYDFVCNKDELDTHLTSLTETIGQFLQTSSTMNADTRLKQLDDEIHQLVDLYQNQKGELLQNDRGYRQALGSIIEKYEELFEGKSKSKVKGGSGGDTFDPVLQSKNGGLTIKYNFSTIGKGAAWGDYEFVFNDPRAAVNFRSDSGIKNGILSQDGATLHIDEDAIDWAKLKPAMKEMEGSYEFSWQEFIDFEKAVKILKEGPDGPQNERY